MLSVVLLAVGAADVALLAHVGGDSGSTIVGVSANTNQRLVAKTTQRTPWIGLLQAQSTQLQELAKGRQVTDVAVQAGWDQLQPTPNGLDATALRTLRSQIQKIRSLKLRPVLDLGLQYPPSWVFKLPGQTRFVDQYGDIWRGNLSEDVPNAVYNTGVQAAEANYIVKLGKALQGFPVTRVRVGGLLSGELRYPPATYNGHSDLIWNYDPAAQSHSPVPGWHPGVGSKADARKALHYYFSSLTRFMTRTMIAVHVAFPTSKEEVLFPSWGLRPGMVDAAINAGMRNTTNAEINGMISAGLDWTSQVAAIARTKIPTYASCTWIDAPSQGSSVQGIPPVAFLTSLARPYAMGVTAENTGGGGSRALSLSMARVKQYRLRGLMYMSGSEIASGRAGITISQMNAAAAQVRHT